MLHEPDLDLALRNIDSLDPSHKTRVLQLLKERDRLANIEDAREHFLSFVKTVWPDFVPGAHHTLMAEAFEKVARGEINRLIINMPPRFTKSQLSSWLLISWFLGKFPGKKIIQASNTENLAAGFGRQVRNLISKDDNAGESKEDLYHQIFPDITLAKDSQAAGSWHTNKGGVYFAVGVNGRVTGMGADIFIVDDPHSEQEAKQAESRPEVFDDVYEWYTSGPRQRLQPGGAVIIVMCMTGDTPVLRPDGSETFLKDIRPGDRVATYENGEINSARVANWRSSGIDTVFTIKTQSGRLLRANARHPFLVSFEGEPKWIRLQDLKVGMEFVATKGANAQPEQKPNRGCAARANLGKLTAGKTPTPPTGRGGTTENGKGCYASNAQQSPHTPEGCAEPVTENNTHHQYEPQSSGGPNGLSTFTESPLGSIKLWLLNATTVATSAVSHLAQKIRGHIGTENFVSTTTITQEKSGGCFAMTATSQSGMERPPRFLNEPLCTFGVTTDKIVSITPSGREEVFDVEVERTENFIANGVVSHNTRWGKRDLAGQVLKKMEADIKSGQKEGTYDKWEVINLPAILDEGLETERSMWPAYWPLETLQATRSAIPVSKWQAQYQQQPTSEEGAIIKREHWRRWGSEAETCPGPKHLAAWNNLEPPACDYILMSLDTAQKKNQRADYSAFTTWGIFKAEDSNTGKTINNIILLSAYKARLEFPELKRKAKQFYNEELPDTLLIEDKSSGISLIQELRSMNIPVENFSYGRGSRAVSNDKVSRANMIADIFVSGYVWAPERRYTEEVASECAEFPHGEHDDYLDSTVQAMLRFRTGGFIRTMNDADDDAEMTSRYTRKRFY